MLIPLCLLSPCYEAILFFFVTFIPLEPSVELGEPVVPGERSASSSYYSLVTKSSIVRTQFLKFEMEDYWDAARFFQVVNF